MVAKTFAATASAGLRVCVLVRQHLRPHAGAYAWKPSETRIGCEPLLAPGFLFFLFSVNLIIDYNFHLATCFCKNKHIS
jgi:hypothetical protein